jgi:pimeloyl-ACP methyl ester carboxylesterase
MCSASATSGGEEAAAVLKLADLAKRYEACSLLPPCLERSLLGIDQPCAPTATAPGTTQAHAYSVFDYTSEVPDRRIAGIRAPTLIVHAKDDTLQPYRSAEFFASTIPGARLPPFEAGATWWRSSTRPPFRRLCTSTSPTPGRGLARRP